MWNRSEQDVYKEKEKGREKNQANGNGQASSDSEPAFCKQSQSANDAINQITRKRQVCFNTDPWTGQRYLRVLEFKQTKKSDSTSKGCSLNLYHWQFNEQAHEFERIGEGDIELLNVDKTLNANYALTTDIVAARNRHTYFFKKG